MDLTYFECILQRRFDQQLDLANIPYQYSEVSQLVFASLEKIGFRLLYNSSQHFCYNVVHPNDSQVLCLIELYIYENIVTTITTKGASVV